MIGHYSLVKILNQFGILSVGIYSAYLTDDDDDDDDDDEEESTDNFHCLVLIMNICIALF